MIEVLVTEHRRAARGPDHLSRADDNASMSCPPCGGTPIAAKINAEGKS